MRILIIGGGQVGYGLSRALAPRHEVVVVDHWEIWQSARWRLTD